MYIRIQGICRREWGLLWWAAVLGVKGVKGYVSINIQIKPTNLGWHLKDFAIIHLIRIEYLTRALNITVCQPKCALTHLDLGALALNLTVNHYFYHLTVEK